MPKRRLVLQRESLGTLESDELASVSGAISAPHPLCAILSRRYSECHSCGFGCSMDCPTVHCPTREC